MKIRFRSLKTGRYVSARYAKSHPKSVLEIKPVGYLYTMHREDGTTHDKFSQKEIYNPFGRRGEDFSVTYKVTCTPLYK